LPGPIAEGFQPAGKGVSTFLTLDNPTAPAKGQARLDMTRVKSDKKGAAGQDCE
jgi:hypothetical protein